MLTTNSIELDPSKVGLKVAIVAMAICLGAILISPVGPMQPILILVSFLYCVYIIRKFVLLSHRNSVISLCWSEEGWFIRLNTQQECHVEVIEKVNLFNVGLAVAFVEHDQHDEGSEKGRGYHRTILFRDSCDPESLRRLRAKLWTG